eukprot:COSAG01_NODE_25016_length_758_cov_1.232170_1_plen_244_part_01
MRLLLAWPVLGAAAVAGQPQLQCYQHTVVSFDSSPVVAWRGLPKGTGAFAQLYNPSWIVASKGTGGRSGLLLRSQNCTEGCSSWNGSVTSCCTCDAGQHPSYLTFAELQGDDNRADDIPTFATVEAASVVFGPYDNATARGTEDPRIAYDERTETYYMYYTCYGYDSDGSEVATLCMAYTKSPLAGVRAWTVVGDLGFGPGTKSAALLLGDGELRHTNYLYWGAGQINLATSSDPARWAPCRKG